MAVKKFAYKICNLSDVSRRNNALAQQSRPAFSFIDLLNELGKQGWEYTGTQPTKQSFLMKREILDDPS